MEPLSPPVAALADASVDVVVNFQVIEHLWDQAQFVRRDVFEATGRYREIPLMEDYDFVRRLERRGRTVCLDGSAPRASWTGPPRRPRRNAVRCSGSSCSR